MLSANDRFLWASNGRSRRRPVIADRDRGRRSWGEAVVRWSSLNGTDAALPESSFDHLVGAGDEH